MKGPGATSQLPHDHGAGSRVSDLPILNIHSVLYHDMVKEWSLYSHTIIRKDRFVLATTVFLTCHRAFLLPGLWAQWGGACARCPGPSKGLAVKWGGKSCEMLLKV